MSGGVQTRPDAALVPSPGVGAGPSPGASHGLRGDIAPCVSDGTFIWRIVINPLLLQDAIDMIADPAFDKS